MNEFTIIIQSQNRNNELRPVNSDASIDDGPKGLFGWAWAGHKACFIILYSGLRSAATHGGNFNFAQRKLGEL